MKIITESEELGKYLERQNAPFIITHHGNGVVEIHTPIPTVDLIFLEILSILKGLNKENYFVTSNIFKRENTIRNVPEQCRTSWNEIFETNNDATSLYVNFEEKW